jgi:DNA-binding MarR family transcriptional regulator
MQQAIDDTRALAEAINEFVEGARRGMARAYDVTRYGLLRLAVTEGGIRPSDAADALDVNPSTITRTAAALELDGLVEVVPDEADARSCRIRPTPAGHRTMAEVEDAGVAVFAAVVRDWDPADIRRFTGYIERLAEDWSAHGPTHTRPRRRPARPHWRAARTEEGAPAR